MRFLFSFLVFVAFSMTAVAQQDGDQVLGIWKNGEGTGKIQIYKTTSGHYAGKIVWLKEPNDEETGKPKVDKRNPDPSKRTNPTLGLVNMKGFKYDADDKEWNGGEIYDPKNGKKYSCKMELANPNSLKVRGYIGISLIGRTDTWTRESK